MLAPVASSPVSDFTTLWRAGHLPLHNGAEMSSLTLRLTSSPRQGFVSGITPAHACRATCRTGNLQGELLSVHKISQACPGTPEIRAYLGHLERTKFLAAPEPDLDRGDLDEEDEEEPWPAHPAVGAQELLRYSRVRQLLQD